MVVRWNTNSFSSRTATASAASLHSVFLEICPIRMTWSGIKIHFRVIVRPLVEVVYEHSNWRAECCTELCSRLYLHSVFLIALESVEDIGDTPELSELTVLVSVVTVEPGCHPLSIAFLLVKTVSKASTWRTILDYTSHASTMRFPISGYSEQSPKRRHSLNFVFYLR